MAAATSLASTTAFKTVAVLGASYGGARAAHILAEGLPHGWRVVLVERNSHMNHLYVLPRYAVLPGHEHKAFIPYDNVFLPPALPGTPPKPAVQYPQERALLLHATVVSLREHELTLDKSYPEHGISDRTLHFDYLVYALGSHLPAPINLWGPVADEVEKGAVVDIVRGTKQGGVGWLKKFQKRVERASSVLVVGGGALGIQYATDIAEIYPTTRVTLLHSRPRLLPRFDEGMHTEILSTLSALNVCAVLGDRLDLASLDKAAERDGAERIVRTQSGREIRAELVLLCTGQTPNTSLLREAFPNVIVADGPSKGMARVRRTLQIAELVDDVPLEAASSSQASASTSSVPEVPVTLAAEQPSDVSSPLTERESVPAASPDEPADEPEEAEESEEEPEPVEEDPCTRVAAEHVFAIGDAADAFGAVNAGHNAFFQGEVAARNIIKLIKRSEREGSESDAPAAGAEPSPGAGAGEATAAEEDLELQKYAPGEPAIKVSLGLTKSVYQFQGMIGVRDKEPADLDVHLIWRYFGHDVSREDLERAEAVEPETASA